MKFKKIMSLLLVLTLISSLLTTVSLLNPMAEDGEEATTPAETTNYDINLLHFKGLSEPVDSQIAVYLKVPADNIVAGEPYTVNLTMHGKTTSDGLTFGDYRDLAVRQGTAKISTTPALAMYAGKRTDGTMTHLYTGGKKWSVTVTPTAKDALYIGLRIQKNDVKFADFYIGNLEVIDKNGNNIAPQITESIFINNTEHHDTTIDDERDLANCFEIVRVESIDDIEDADLKQKLFSDFYTGDSMINFKKGSTEAIINLYKRIPASKLKPNTTYTYTVRYNNPEAFCDNNLYRYFVINDRVGGKNTIFSSTNSTYTKLSMYVDCYEFTAEYTTGATANEIYVGFRMHRLAWANADLYIADMQFVEKGTTQNLLTPMSEMDYYYAVSDGGNVNPFHPGCGGAYNYTTVTKSVLDKEKYFEPENQEAAKYLYHVVGKSDTTNPRGTLVKIPATLTQGEKYTLNMTVYGKGLVASYNQSVLAVQNGTASGGIIASTNTDGTTTTLHSGSIKWSVEITPDASKELFIGWYLSKANVQTCNVYIGNVEIIDKNGNNIAPVFQPGMELWGYAGYGGAPQKDSATESGIFPTREFVRLDKIEDETLKQKLFDDFYKGDTMLHFKDGPFESTSTAEHAQAIYKKIPKSKLEANKKYKFSIKYKGLTLSNDDYIVFRDNATKSNNIKTSIGKQSTNIINHGNYYEYVDYYTTPATEEELTDLYIGFFIRGSAWTNTHLYIADMQFVDADGNNCFTPIYETHDLWRGYNAGAISEFKLNSGAQQVAMDKLVLDTTMFGDPVSTDRKMVNIEGLSNTAGARLYLKLSGALPGTYQVSYKTKGFDCSDDSYFAVKTKSSGTSDNIETVAGTNKAESIIVSQPSLDEATYEFTATDFTDIYVGFDVAQSLVPDMDFIIENLELVRIPDGKPSKNLIDGNLNLTNWISFNGDYTTETKVSIGENGIYQGSVYKISLVDYDESALNPEQIVNIKGGKEPKYVLYAKSKTNAPEGIAVYVKIPAERVEANKTYTVKAVQKGMAMGVDENFAVRQTKETVANGGVLLVSSDATLTPESDGAYKWTAEFTTTAKADLYVGIRLSKTFIRGSVQNFYFGDIEVIDEDGNNLVDELQPSTGIHRTSHHGTTIHNYAVLSDYFETIEFVDINSIDNEDIANIFAKHKPEDDDAGSEEKMNQNYQLGKRANGLKAGTYKIKMVQFGADIENSANPNFRVVLNGVVKYQTYDEATRQAYVEKVGTGSYKFEATVEVTEDDSNIQCEFIVGPYVMSNLNSYIKELSVVKVDGDDESENLLSALNVRDWRAANGDFLAADKYNSLLQSINNINSTVADANGNGKVDVADMRILRKMQDAGVEVTDDTNLATLRNNLLGIAS